MNVIQPYDAPSSWLANYYPRPHPALRLFCFPFAGGGPSTYRTWSKMVPEEVEVCPIALPGRETRIREPFITQFFPLVRILLRALYPLMNRPFAFFGHSMGSLVCYELARALRQEGGPMPVHMFLSAYVSPNTLRLDHKPVSKMSDAEFLEMLRGFNGIPAAVLNSPELLSIFVPILRADFALEETYEFRPEPPFDCPFTVFGGLRDTSVGEEKQSLERADQRAIRAAHGRGQSLLHPLLRALPRAPLGRAAPRRQTRGARFHPPSAMNRCVP